MDLKNKVPDFFLKEEGLKHQRIQKVVFGAFSCSTIINQVFTRALTASGFRCRIISVKGTLLSLRQFFATKSPSKIMKNPFYSTLKALFVLQYLSFCLDLFVHLGKRLDKKDQVNFKFYDVTAWLTSNCNAHIAQ